MVGIRVHSVPTSAVIGRDGLVGRLLDDELLDDELLDDELLVGEVLGCKVRGLLAGVLLEGGATELLEGGAAELLAAGGVAETGGVECAPVAGEVDELACADRLLVGWACLPGWACWTHPASSATVTTTAASERAGPVTEPGAEAGLRLDIATLNLPQGWPVSAAPATKRMTSAQRRQVPRG